MNDKDCLTDEKRELNTGKPAAAATSAGAAGRETTKGAAGLNPTDSPSEGRYIDYPVVDRNDQKVGTVESVWLSSDNDPAYLSVRTGWLGWAERTSYPHKTFK